jgi:hypothetical protein
MWHQAQLQHHGWGHWAAAQMPRITNSAALSGAKPTRMFTMPWSMSVLHRMPDRRSRIEPAERALELH